VLCVQVTAYWYNGVVVPSNWAGKPRPYRDFYLKVDVAVKLAS